MKKKEAGFAVPKLSIKAGTDFSIFFGGKMITKNGYHEFFEVMKDGKKWIVDNINPNGIPYDNFI